MRRPGAALPRGRRNRAAKRDRTVLHPLGGLREFIEPCEKERVLTLHTERAPAGVRA